MQGDFAAPPFSLPLGGRCPSAHTGADEGTGFGFPFVGCAVLQGFALRGELLCPRRQSNQNATGDGSDEHSVLIVAFPRTPLRGTRTCWILQNFRRAKMEWPPRFIPGHWALGLQKLPLLRFPWCAWPGRAGDGWSEIGGPAGVRPLREEGTAPMSAVGAGP